MIKWRTAAVNDLTRIRDYIREFATNAAHAVVERVLRSVERLKRFPESGRPGGTPTTREVVVPGLPYIVAYLTAEDDVEIITVVHAAQDRR